MFREIILIESLVKCVVLKYSVYLSLTVQVWRCCVEVQCVSVSDGTSMACVVLKYSVYLSLTVQVWRCCAEVQCVSVSDGYKYGGLANTVTGFQFR